MLHRIRESLLKDSRVLMVGDYPYIITPLLDGIPEVKPELLLEAVELIWAVLGPDDKIDKVVTMEAMGIPLAVAYSLERGVPYNIIRKRSYGLPDEMEVPYKTGYGEGRLYINGLKRGDKILLLDDVYSTGGTMRAVRAALDKIGVEVVACIVLVDKGKDPEAPFSLVKLEVREGRIWLA